MIYGLILDCCLRGSFLKNIPTKCRNKCNVYGMKCGWFFAFILIQSLYKIMDFYTKNPDFATQDSSNFEVSVYFLYLEDR